jgi:hypothetical protein
MATRSTSPVFFAQVACHRACLAVLAEQITGKLPGKITSIVRTRNPVLDDSVGDLYPIDLGDVFPIALQAKPRTTSCEFDYSLRLTRSSALSVDRG